MLVILSGLPQIDHSCRRRETFKSLKSSITVSHFFLDFTILTIFNKFTPVVWTVLYILFSLAYHRVLICRRREKRIPSTELLHCSKLCFPSDFKMITIFYVHQCGLPSKTIFILFTSSQKFLVAKKSDIEAKRNTTLQ